MVETGKFGGKPAQIKMLWMYSANPLNTHTDTHAWTDVIIPAMEYVVVADSAMTDSARYADMVLPIAQWFELEEVANAGQCSSLHYSEKAIDPLYESKPDPQIVTELAQKLGLGDYFKLDNGGILEEMYDTDMGKALGMDMGNLREKSRYASFPEMRRRILISRMRMGNSARHRVASSSIARCRCLARPLPRRLLLKRSIASVWLAGSRRSRRGRKTSCTKSTRLFS